MKKAQNRIKLLAVLLPLLLTGGACSASEQTATQSEDRQFSANPVLRKAELETEAKLKKAKGEEKADLLYDLAKLAFEEKDFERAERYMKESLAHENVQKRPDEAAKTHLALAILYAVRNQTEPALAQYETALAIAEKSGLKDFVNTITDSIGTLALRAGKLDEADRYFKKAFQLGVENKEIPTQMNALTNQATVLRLRQKRREALELLKQCLEISKQGEADRSLGLALVNLARVEYDLHDWDNAVNSFKRAAEVFREDIDPESEADAYLGLGEAYFDLRKTENAKEAYDKGLSAVKEEADSLLKFKLLIGLGCAEADLGHFDIAQNYHKQAAELAQKMNYRNEELEAILQMGNDLLLSGYPEAGLFRLLDGEKLIETANLDLKMKGTFLIAIGRCYKVLGDWESAQKYYEEALKLYESVSDERNRALALVSLAVLALDFNNTADFQRYYEEAKKAYQNSSEYRELAILDYNYSQFLITQLKYEEALSYSSKALEEIKQSGDKVSESLILRGMGLAQYLAKHPQQAMSTYEKALALAEQSADIEGKWDAHLGLGKCFKALGLNDMAVSHLSKAVDLVEEERGRLARDSFKTHTLDVRNDCFVELAELYIILNKPYDALAVAEKGRARAFLDMLSSRRSGRSVETFLSPISSRESEKNEPEKIAMAAPEAGSRGVSVIPRASQIYSSTAVSPVNASAPGISEMKELVEKSASTQVIYYILQNKVAVWIIDPDSKIHMLAPIRISNQELSEKIALAYQSITEHPKDPKEVAALAQRRQDSMRELYELLIKPVEPHLPQNPESVVSIVPHGPMFMIPFAALLDENKQFFVEKHTLAYIPAIGVYRATQKLDAALAAKENKLLAFGNPITRAIAFLGALPYSEKEVENIAGLFGAQSATVKIKEDANKKAFETLAPQFTQIHLATHGLVDEERPMQSSLVLAPSKGDDGLLSVKDILAMKELKAKLVVLSACQTGRGKITGDGVVGLSRAFIIAGTPAVVVSQWNVDDIITEYQMKSFYKSYLANTGKAKSLRQAQLDTIKFMEGANFGKGNSGIRANPRYWAAFQLIGNAN